MEYLSFRCLLPGLTVALSDWSCTNMTPERDNYLARWDTTITTTNLQLFVQSSYRLTGGHLENVEQSVES